MDIETVDMLSAALHYHSLGFSVIPVHTIRSNGKCSCGNPKCNKPGKHPRIAWKPSTTTKLSESEIKGYWEKDPDSNIALVCGEVSGTTVIDIDGETGLKSMEAIGFGLDKLPPTPTSQTGGNGFHCFYKYNKGFSKNMINLLDKVDLKSDSGYVVVPPSLHASGRRYVWLPDRSIDDLPIADFDFSLLVKEKPKNKSTAKDEAWYEELLKGVPEGQRNDAAAKLVGRYVQKGMVREEIVPIMLDWNQKNSPPSPEEEVLQVIDSIISREQSNSRGKYRIHDGCMCKIKIDNGEEILLPLCNFVAEVVEDVSKDDGIEIQRYFTVEGKLQAGRVLPKIQVSSASFAGLTWVIQNWGVNAVIAAGQTVRDCLREAIQGTSQNAVKRTIYCHTGWREIDDKWIFLSTDMEGVDVELPKPLQKYRLPSSCNNPKEAIQASLRLLDVAPYTVTVPLLSAMYAAPLASIMPLRFLLYLYGPTGNMKTTMVCAAISHFGGPFDRANVPSTFESTANFLEHLASQAKDVALLIDDMYPQSTEHDARQQEMIVQRLVRGQSSHSGRGRLRPDATARTSYSARGLIVATGELLPSGQSTLARMIVLELSRDQINIDKLSRSQEELDLYPSAMRHYLDWLAPQINDLRKTLPQELIKQRKELRRSDGHLNVAEMSAQLIMGWKMFLRCAFAIHAIDEVELVNLQKIGRQAMAKVADSQQQRISDEQPTHKFINIIKELLAQKRIYVCDKQTDKEPADFEYWGWIEKSTYEGIEKAPAPGAEKIGWVDDQYAYLFSESTYKVVARVAREQGEPITIKKSTLYMQLRKAKILIPEDNKNSFGKKICGTTPRIIRLDRRALQ